MNTFISEKSLFLDKITNYLIKKNWKQLDNKIVYNYNEIEIENKKDDIKCNLLLTIRHIRRYIGLYNVDIYNHIGNMNCITNYYDFYQTLKQKKYLLKTLLIDIVEYNYDFKIISDIINKNLSTGYVYILRPYTHNIIEEDIITKYNDGNINDIIFINRYNCSKWSIIEYSDNNNIIINTVIVVDKNKINAYTLININKRIKKIIVKIFKSNLKKLVLNKYSEKGFEIVSFLFSKINGKIKLLNIYECDKYKNTNIDIDDDMLNLILYDNIKPFQLLYSINYDQFNKSIIKTLTGYSFNRIENFITVLDFYVNNIKQYKLNFIYDIEIKTLRRIKNKNIIDNKFNGRYTTLVRTLTEYKFFNKITNMFIEKCNIKCKFNKYKTMHELSNDKDLISDGLIYMYNNNLDITKDNLTSFIYHKTKICSYFPVCVAYGFYKYFNANSVLDISAGWGDRLIAACINEISYYSCDPNICNKPYYNQIIDILGNHNKQKVILSGFENLTINDNYDLIFSSPPFFDLEIYSNDSDQSNIKYPTSEKWIYNFLYVVIKKAWQHLNINGHMCLYMKDYTNLSYCEDMIVYCINNLKKCNFLGVINIIIIQNNTDINTVSNSNSNPLWVFQKK